MNLKRVFAMPQWQPSRRRILDEIDEEFHFHLQQRVLDSEAEGMDPAEARRDAERRFGDTRRYREQGEKVLRSHARKQARANSLSTLIDHLRFALRSLGKSPGFTGIALTTIGLGIGATTLVFSVLYGVLLKPLPYADADRLVTVWVNLKAEDQLLPEANPADFRDYQLETTSFEELAAASPLFRTLGVLTGDGPPLDVDISGLTRNFLSMLGIHPVLGRHFTEADEAVNGPRVAMLSNELWTTRFGSDTSLVGSTIELDGDQFEVVGILPPGFKLLIPAENLRVRHSDVWVPLQTNYANLPPRNQTWYLVVGKLNRGVTLGQAQAEMDALALRLRERHTEHETADMEILLVSFQNDIVKQMRPVLFTLFGAVGFVFLIACANVAHLFLLRGAARERELAVRVALGASPQNVAMQVVTESLLIGVIGSGVGLAIAQVGLHVLGIVQPPNLPLVSDVGIDAIVIVFAAVAAIATTVIFGLIPAIQAGRTDVNELLNESGRSGGSKSKVRFRNTLVIGEVSFSVVLLVGTGLMIRSFLALQDVRPGFDANGVLTFTVSLPGASYPNRQSRIDFLNELEMNLAGLPGVESVGATSGLPLATDVSQQLWYYAYDEETLPTSTLTANVRAITPDYFRVIGTQLLAGRFFDEGDLWNNVPVVIVEGMLAEQAWPGEDPIGKALHIIQWDPRYFATVVGVVEHVRIYDLTRDVNEHYYLPHTQPNFNPLMLMSVALKVAPGLDPLDLAPAVRRTVWAIDDKLPVNRLRPLSYYVRDARSPIRFLMILMTSFGGVALLLASVGIYGVISYSVKLRRREFGLRLALGQTPSGLMANVLGGSVRLVVVSLVLGAGASVVMARFIKTLLYEVNATDPLTYGVISVVLFCTAMVACSVPAMRAARTDPVSVLKAD